MSFSDEDVFKLIELYKQFSCLWDFKSPEYKRIDKKKNAWEEISKQLNKNDDIVKKKMKNLRSAYLLEKKKVDASKKSGTAADALHEPHLFYYTEMQFLDQAIAQRKTSSNLAIDTEIIEISPLSVSASSNLAIDTEIIEISPLSVSASSNLAIDTEIIEISPLSVSESESPLCNKKRSSKRIKLENAEKLNCALDTLIEQVNNEKTENQNMFSIFAKSIGMQLAVLPLNVASEAMAEFQRILSEKMSMISSRDILNEAMYEANIH